MRAIKFRAWDTANKEMFQVRTLQWDAGDSLCLSGWVEDIMQFTGLLDCNGKEIYEGDVVRTPNGDWGVIQYAPPFFGVTVSATEVANYRRDWMESCEVIGNIHEHPELCQG